MSLYRLTAEMSALTKHILRPTWGYNRDVTQTGASLSREESC